MARFEMHSHSDMSNIRLIDCINTVDSLVNYAVEIGLEGICLTDHEALGNWVKLDQIRQKIQEKNPDFKIGYGNEVYLIDERGSGQRYWHFILIAKDAIGAKMLRKLSSNSWMNSYFDRGMERVPTLKAEVMACVDEFGKGHLIASSACLGSELDYCILEMDKAERVGNLEGKAEYYYRIVDFVNWCKSVFGDDYYFEIQPAQSKEQMIVNRRMKALSDYFGVKIVVTTDAHYLKKSDREVHKAFLNSKQGDREVDEFYAYAYLQTTEEVIQNLEGTGLDYAELEVNTLEVKSKIQDFGFAHKQQVPQVPVKDYPKVMSKMGYKTLDYLYSSDNPQERYWVNYCCDKLRELNLFNDVYLARLEEEADIQKVIGEKLGTCMFAYPIFLQHYIDSFWEIGSTVGAGRGSACSGLNHYLLGITQLDPIKYNLPYWRYSNKERIELGDIDIDICPSKREEIFKSIREEVGQLGCVQVCTYGTETTRSAISTACRGYRSKDFPDGIDNDVAQYMTSLAPSERGFVWPVHDLVYGNEEKDRKPVKNFLAEVRKYPGLLEIIEKIEGLINHRGIHASGVNFYMNDPFDSACFMKATSGAIVTQFSLHDAEYCGDVKFDFLVTEIQDVIVQCLNMLSEYNEVDQDLSLRQLYDKYLHPDVLPIDDDKMWDVLAEGKVLKLFQFDSQVGSQTVKMLRPRSPREMANCNSVMRLMASEKGGETPTERYKRMKDNMSRWYDEMSRWHLREVDQKTLENYYLETYATPAQQEDMMMILMDPDICGFSLKEANDARKICAKKQMNRIEELHELVLKKAVNQRLGEYVWETAIKPQMGYSFSLIHSLAYSFVGLQTIYLATYFDPVYWNTACLRVDAGLDEDASSNYGKIAKAVGNIIHRGIPMSLIDINKSGYMFEPDVETGSILFGMKGLNGVGGEIIQDIIENRPYESFNDFQERVKVKKPVLISLIKSGAFDKFGNREDIMREYIWSICEPKKRLTLQNFNGLMERNLIPDSLSFERRLFVFNKALRKFCKIDDVYILPENFYEFYEEFFDVDLTTIHNGEIAIDQKVWQKLYTKGMDKARDYLREHQEEMLRQLNQTLFNEVWNKYAAGTLSTWEMDSLGFYYHDHPMKKLDKLAYNVKAYNSLPDNPPVEKTFKRNGVDIPLFKTCRIVGAVVAKEDNKSCVSILTPESGVVTVKMSRDYYARLNRQMSQVQPDGTKKVMEKGWFTRGTLLMFNGFKRSGMFFTKSYRHTKSHQCYHILTEVKNNGTIDMTAWRWGEEGDDEN